MKYQLDESRIPTHWYNLVPDLPTPPPPPLHPATHEPVGPDDLAPLFPMALIQQEVSGESHIEIPDAVRDAYRLWRPTPLYRARRLGAGPRHTGTHLLQVRGRQPRRVAQAQHLGAPGVLQRRRRRPAAHHRDRRRPVGHRRWPSPARCSTSSARCGRSAPPTTRSRTAGR
ncbi:MAG: hypothetical protein U5R31_07750 [Acidimicrobiia bacterium]|nr:hypothetical protein [Acidimicrobiia bacterium]